MSEAPDSILHHPPPNLQPETNAVETFGPKRNETEQLGTIGNDSEQFGTIGNDWEQMGTKAKSVTLWRAIACDFQGRFYTHFKKSNFTYLA